MKIILLYALCCVGFLTMSGRLFGSTINPLSQGLEVMDVKNLTVTLLPGDQKIQVKWDHDMSEVVKDFRIIRNGLVIADVFGDNQYVDSGFPACFVNSYKVLAIYNGSISPGKVYVLINNLPNNVDIKLEVIPAGINVTGINVSFVYAGTDSLTTYVLERSVDGVSGINLLNFTSHTKEYFDPTGPACYYYRVKSYNKYCTTTSDWIFITSITGPYKQLVFSELFSGENCTFGRYMEELQDAFTSDKQDSFVGIKYYMPWRDGAAKGHFYGDNSADANARANYYNVYAVPTGYMNGIRKYVGASTTNFDLWKNTYYTDKSSITPFRIEITQKINPVNSKIDFRIVVRCESSVPGNLKLRIAIVEKSLEFIEAPGSNGQIHFEDLMKKFIPDAAGLSLKNNWMPNDSWVYENSWVFSKYMYTISSARVVAFIQDEQSKYVYQAGVSKALADPNVNIDANSVGNSEFALFPIPANDYVFVKMNLNSDENVNFRIANASGMVIQDLDHSGQAGNNLVRLDLSDLAPGIYFVHTSYGNYSETFRLVVQ